ncbi:MAG: flavodoxin [Muribaculaceae bacterium]
MNIIKKLMSLMIAMTAIVGCPACAGHMIDSNEENGNDATGKELFGGKKVLVVYYSWGGTTRKMAQEIVRVTGGDVFEIVPVTPYPTEYTPCTEVALEERDSDARPRIKDRVTNWNDYDVVFVGCPVWWHTAPMIISTFAESYDFKGKTVIPFCTYGATYRDETLQKIVDLTPEANHLSGHGTTGSISGVEAWVKSISAEWNEQLGGSGEDVNEDGAANPSVDSKAPMSGKVNLWYKGNIPTVTHNVNNSDGPDFIANMEVFTVSNNVTPKGAVIICPGGAFQFRSMQNEGYDIANMLVPMGYQCFIVNYRIAPYTMRESATDLSRAIRYVRAHAADYRIDAEDIALVGFSAGGILNGEVLLNWRDKVNGTALDADYRPDALDEIPVDACAVGMIYSFYGRLSVSMNDVATLRAANLPPAFYCWGTRDGFAGQFTQNANAVSEAGCEVETHILEGYPHGYGSGGNASVWGNDFDKFLTRIMTTNKTETFTRTSLIADVMNDAAFNGYGRLIFPVNTSYWSGNTLEQLRLTYYNYIDPDKTVENVNYMKRCAMAGETIFYDIYTDAEKHVDDELSNTGLFFFRGEQDAPFAVCNAGGAFAYVGAMHDSFPHALELSKKGYNAFALIYRPGDAYEDLARAIEFIHDNAKTLGVDAEGYSLWGGSAGARMAATLGNRSYLNQFTDRNDIGQAAAVVMQYTGYTDVSRYDAPTYACVGTSDGIASWRTMQSRLESLASLGIPTEFHAYSGLPHGFGLGTGTVAEGWIDDAVAFWESQLTKTKVSQK